MQAWETENGSRKELMSQSVRLLVQTTYLCASEMTPRLALLSGPFSPDCG